MKRDMISIETQERIKAEAVAFFEWDGEDRSLVTTTSCLLFAQHIAGLMQARAAQPAPVVPEGELAQAVLETILGWAAEDWSWHFEQYPDLAERVRSQLVPTRAGVDAMVGRFLSWPLPADVCADPCASMPDYPHRSGTNLLNAEQAKAMLLHVLAAAPAQVLSFKDDPRKPHELSAAGCRCVRFGEGNPHWPCPIHAAPAQGQQVEWRTTAVMLEQANAGLAQLNGKLRAELSALKAHPEAYQFDGQVLRDEHGNYLAEFMAYEQSFIDRLLHPQPELKAQQVGQEPAGEVHLRTGGGISLLHVELAQSLPPGTKLYTAPQPAPAQDVAGLASSDPVAKAEFETRLRKEFESRWPKPKGVTWGAGINDYCVSEFAEGIALSYPDMWMAYKAGAMRTNQ